MTSSIWQTVPRLEGALQDQVTVMAPRDTALTLETVGLPIGLGRWARAGSGDSHTASSSRASAGRIL